MDLVYTYRHSQWYDNEIRYSLRSVEKYLSGSRDIYIIGEMPKLIQNIKFIEFADSSEIDTNNVIRKLLVASHNPDISDPFIWMHDDFMINRPIDSCAIRPWYNGRLKDYISYCEKRKPEADKSKYVQTLRNTLSPLNDRANGMLNYELHVPFAFHKELLQEAVTMMHPALNLNWCIRSVYGNRNYSPGKWEMEDVKINKYLQCDQIIEWIGENTFFSLGNKSCSLEVLDALNHFYPDKSRYEI